MSLALTTLVVAVTLAVTFGVIAAWKAGSLIDRLLMVLSVVGFSVPVFVVGYLLIYVFAINLRWLPVQGYTPIREGLGPWLHNLVLPSIALGLAYVALIARITRATHDGGAGGGLHPHRQGEGRGDGLRAAQARAPQRRRAHRHHRRHRRGAADLGRRHHRDRVQHPRRRPAGGGRHRQARLPDHPGRDPHHRGGLCVHQPAGGPLLRDPRSEDQGINDRRRPHRPPRTVAGRRP